MVTNQLIPCPDIPRRSLPPEILLAIVDELCRAPNPLSFMRENQVTSTLAALALVSRTANSIATPDLYQRVQLVEVNEHVLFRRTLSQSPRRTYLASLVKSFFAAVPFDLVWRLVEDNIALVRLSVEVLHVQKWSCARGRSANPPHDLTSFPKLRTLSVEGPSIPIPPLQQVPQKLERLLLDVYSAESVVESLLEESRKGITGGKLTIYVYCVGVENHSSILGLWHLIRAFGEDPTSRRRRLPSVRIVHILYAQACKMAHRWISGRGPMDDQCYCLPVPSTRDAHNWLRGRIGDGSLWDLDVIPMDSWAYSVKERCPHGF